MILNLNGPVKWHQPLINRKEGEPDLTDNILKIINSRVWESKNSNVKFQMIPMEDVKEFKISSAEQEPETISLGSGYIETRPQVGNEKFSVEQLNELSKYNEDFAILKFDLKKNKIKCLKVDKINKIQGRLVSIGYPINPYDLRHPNLKTIESPQTLNLETIKSNLKETPKSELDLYDQNKVMLIDPLSPIIPGMSGGPTLNSEGEVIGVNFAGTNEYSALVRTSYIYQKTINEFGLEQASKIFNCIN